MNEYYLYYTSVHVYLVERYEEDRIWVHKIFKKPANSHSIRPIVWKDSCTIGPVPKNITQAEAMQRYPELFI